MFFRVGVTQADPPRSSQVKMYWNGNLDKACGN
ncbi:hypothetical protein WCLP8_3600002 [uncultured Gammaproteobacteria bacterium]